MRVKSTLYTLRTETYKDFTLRLLFYIDMFYLDRKTLNNDDDILNHFTYCFKKTCNDFLRENMDFSNNDNLFNFLFDYYYDNMYDNNLTIDIKIEQHKQFWDSVFNIKDQKNTEHLVILTELYGFFDYSLNKKNIVLVESN